MPIWAILSKVLIEFRVFCVRERNNWMVRVTTRWLNFFNFIEAICKSGRSHSLVSYFWLRTSSRDKRSKHVTPFFSSTALSRLLASHLADYNNEGAIVTLLISLSWSYVAQGYLLMWNMQSHYAVICCHILHLAIFLWRDTLCGWVGINLGFIP